MKIQEKISAIKKKFVPFSASEKYHLIIEMGQKLKPIPKELKIEKNRIKGCQSELYFFSEYIDQKIYFYADSDALISKGLAALLIEVFEGAPPLEILTTPIDFLQEIGILGAISPNRSNGLASLYAQIKKDALNSIHIDTNPTK